MTNVEEDGVCVCVFVGDESGRGRGRGRERERTRISPSYSGLHATAHVLPTFGNTVREL